jgi:hypothetical protein
VDIISFTIPDKCITNVSFEIAIYNITNYIMTEYNVDSVYPVFTEEYQNKYI